jgi:hypothetical protein
MEFSILFILVSFRFLELYDGSLNFFSLVFSVSYFVLDTFRWVYSPALLKLLKPVFSLVIINSSSLLIGFCFMEFVLSCVEFDSIECLVC